MIPNWFFGYDIVLEVLFGVIAAFVAFYALRMYNLTRQREFGLFGASFILISLSYFAWSIINLLLVEELNETTRVLVLNEINVLGVIGIYSHILLFMAGLITLLYMTCKVKDPKLYSALIIISSLAILFAYNKSLLIYTLSSVILVYITFYYGLLYQRTKAPNLFQIFMAFFILLVANIITAFVRTESLNYVSIHLLQLISFGIILFTLVRTLKHGQKKK